MASIEVEVDIDEFDDDDILDEVIDRLKRNLKGIIHRSFKNCEEELQDVFDLLKKMPQIKGKPEADNLADQMKQDYINEIFGKFTEAQFREMVFIYEDKKNGKFNG
jgi:DNA anti-recombination protein RmuC